MAPYLRGLMNADLPCLIKKVRSPAGTSVVQSENPCIRWNSGSAVWSWPRRSEIRYAGRKYLNPASEKKLSAVAWPSRKPASMLLQSSSLSKGPTSSYGSHPSKLPCKKRPPGCSFPAKALRILSITSSLKLILTPEDFVGHLSLTIVNHRPRPAVLAIMNEESGMSSEEARR